MASPNEKTDIWMPLYIGDYLASTTHLSAEESGGYLHLLMHEWRNGPLPNDEKLLARIARIDSSSWNSAWSVIGPFFTEEGGRFIQKRLEAERGGARDRKASSEQRNIARWGEASTAERGRDLRSKRLSEARKLGTHTAYQWEAMKRHFRGLCVRCNEASDVVKDHILPIYQGGSDGIENIQPLCRKCNASKGPENKDWRIPGWEEAISEAINASEMPLNASTSPSPSPSSIKDKELSIVETDDEQTPKLALEPEPDKTSTPEQRDAVAQVFDYYLEKVGKKITLYALTSKRMQKGLVCLRECLRREDGNVQKAFAKMCDAVDGLTFNDWNMGRDRNSVRQYTDWEEHVFKNVETMEKRWDDFYRKAKAS